MIHIHLLYVYFMFWHMQYINIWWTFVLMSQSTTAPNTAGSPRKASKHVSFGSLPTMRSSTPDPMESRKSR